MAVASPTAPPLIDLPGGLFTMGRADRRPDERPPHHVRLAPFCAAATPVSNAEYDVFLATTDREPLPFRDDPRFGHPDQPAVGVSWFDSVAYCDWLGSATGLPLRLPSEAEREFAARGAPAPDEPARLAPGPDWPWGDVDPADSAPLAFVARAESPHVPQPACANALGLRCMAENVHEWCLDVYARRYDPGRPVPRAVDPAQVDPEQRRVSRGGSWRHRVKFTRLTARSSLPPGYRYNDYGFRVYASL